MNLILWRHGDAEEGAPDDARRLTERGAREAERVARWRRARLPQDFRVLASPARRARETARALAEEFEVSAKVGTAADAESVLEAAGWPHAGGTIVVVGHQPTLGQAAALALTGSPADWSIRKGALWWLERRAGGEAVVRAVIEPDLA
jgi:phosphohistidine phosphatase